MSHLIKEIYVKLFADRGYFSKNLFEKLFQRNITLVTKLKKNMKNKFISLSDKILTRKWAVIESVNDLFKNICSNRILFFG